MFDNILDNLFDSAYYILESHSIYISKGEKDQNKYFIAPEVLEALVWICLNVSLPILVGVASSIVSDHLKKKKGSEELTALNLKKDKLESLKSEVEQALEKANLSNSRASNDTSLLIQADLAQILEINGWPSSIATTDAKGLLLEIHQKIRKDKENG